MLNFNGSGLDFFKIRWNVAVTRMYDRVLLLLTSQMQTESKLVMIDSET